jgi:hypothetical protein
LIKTVIALLIAAMATFVIVAGCGSGDNSNDAAEGANSGSTTVRTSEPEPGRPSEPGDPILTTSLTKAQFIERATGICQASWADMAKNFALYLRTRQGSKASKGQQFAYGARNNFLPHMQFWFDDIAYLGASKGEKPEVEDMLDALQQAVWSGGERRITSPEQMSLIFSSFNRLAALYGLDGCLVDEAALEALYAN